jgi:hypothetical protein
MARVCLRILVERRLPPRPANTAQFGDPIRQNGVPEWWRCRPCWYPTLRSPLVRSGWGTRLYLIYLYGEGRMGMRGKSQSAAGRVVLCVLAFSLAGAGGCRRGGQQEDASVTGTETIVVMRHGEKPQGGLGQLSCKGLNRALALPKMLMSRFGRADAIFVPNPAVEMKESALGQTKHSYVRPLATIEPTAIALGLPVHAQIGFPEIAELQQEVTAPKYAKSTVFIVWEHKYARDFAREMLRTYRLDRSVVPPWPGDDFETLYVFRITRVGGGSRPVMTFRVEQEGLSGSLSDVCPGQ